MYSTVGYAGAEPLVLAVLNLCILIVRLFSANRFSRNWLVAVITLILGVLCDSIGGGLLAAMAYGAGGIWMETRVSGTLLKVIGMQQVLVAMAMGYFGIVWQPRWKRVAVLTTLTVGLVLSVSFAALLTFLPNSIDATSLKAPRSIIELALLVQTCLLVGLYGSSCGSLGSRSPTSSFRLRLHFIVASLILVLFVRVYIFIDWFLLQFLRFSPAALDLLTVSGNVGWFLMVLWAGEMMLPQTSGGEHGEGKEPVDSITVRPYGIGKGMQPEDTTLFAGHRQHGVAPDVERQRQHTMRSPSPRKSPPSRPPTYEHDPSIRMSLRPLSPLTLPDEYSRVTSPVVTHNPQQSMTQGVRKVPPNPDVAPSLQGSVTPSKQQGYLRQDKQVAQRVPAIATTRPMSPAMANGANVPRATGQEAPVPTSRPSAAPILAQITPDTPYPIQPPEIPLLSSSPSSSSSSKIDPSRAPQGPVLAAPPSSFTDSPPPVLPTPPTPGPLPYELQEISKSSEGKKNMRKSLIHAAASHRLPAPGNVSAWKPLLGDAHDASRAGPGTPGIPRLPQVTGREGSTGLDSAMQQARSIAESVRAALDTSTNAENCPSASPSPYLETMDSTQAFSSRTRALGHGSKPRLPRQGSLANPLGTPRARPIGDSASPGELAIVSSPKPTPKNARRPKRSDSLRAPKQTVHDAAGYRRSPSPPSLPTPESSFGAVSSPGTGGSVPLSPTGQARKRESYQSVASSGSSARAIFTHMMPEESDQLQWNQVPGSLERTVLHPVSEWGSQGHATSGISPATATDMGFPASKPNTSGDRLVMTNDPDGFIASDEEDHDEQLRWRERFKDREQRNVGAAF